MCFLRLLFDPFFCLRAPEAEPSVSDRLHGDGPGRDSLADKDFEWYRRTSDYAGIPLNLGYCRRCVAPLGALVSAYRSLMSGSFGFGGNARRWRPLGLLNFF